MTFKSETGTQEHTPVKLPAGQHLYCHNCGSEVEVVIPCRCEPSDMVIRCCERDMLPEVAPDR